MVLTMSLDDMTPIVSCGFLVFRQEPNYSFLLMRHKDRWDLPKGHVDAGESFQHCALRELSEETGITADEIEIETGFEYRTEYTVKLRRYGDSPRNKTLIIYLATLTRPVEILATEHLGFEWFDWNPPHIIQSQAIDPLLAYVEDWLSRSSRNYPDSKRDFE